MEPVKFAPYSHKTPDEGVCVMEYVSVLVGGEFTDWPDCTHPLLARLAQHANDALDNDERTPTLAPLVPRLMGTNTDDPDAYRAMLEAIGAYRTLAWYAGDGSGISPKNVARLAAAEAGRRLPCGSNAYGRAAVALLIAALDALEAYNAAKAAAADLDAQWNAWAGRVLETVP